MLHKRHVQKISHNQNKNTHQKNSYLEQVELRKAAFAAISLTFKNENNVKLIKQQIATTDHDVFCSASKDEAAILFNHILDNEFLNESEKNELIRILSHLVHLHHKLFQAPLRDKMLQYPMIGRTLYELYTQFCKIHSFCGMASTVEDDLWRCMAEARVCTPQELYVSCMHIRELRERFFSFVRIWLEAMRSPQELFELYENFIHSSMIRDHMDLHTSGLLLRTAKHRLLALVISVPPKTKELEEKVKAFLNKWESAFTLFFQTKTADIYEKLRDKREEAIDEFKALRHKLTVDLVDAGLVRTSPKSFR